MSFQDKAKKAINDIVKQWTNKYLFHIMLAEKNGPQYIFRCEFSLPTPQKPITIATVQVYFYVKQSKTGMEITFRYQKDSLIHTPDKTIRNTQMEKWLESILVKKLLTRQNVFYLGTEYEVTRVKDARQDKILEKKIIVQKPEIAYIAPQLLQDQKRSIDIMESHNIKGNIKQTIKQYFRRADKSKMGVVTVEQFLQILKNMNLQLKQDQINEVIKRVDSQKNGLITYNQYEQIATQIVKSTIAKNQAQQKLKNQSEQYQLQSIMVLINDEVHQISKSLNQKLKKLDQDEKNYLKLPEIKKILEQLNNESVTSGKQEILSIVQISEFTKRLSQKYSFNEVYYNNLYNEIIEFKIQNLKKGLIQSNLNNLEVYLRQIFDPFDRDKFGKISVDDMILAFKKSEKIILTKGQLYVLRSFVDKDQRDHINYITSSKLLAQILKRFYLTSHKKKQ